MNRAVLYGLVLASAAAGAVLWASSSSVQGRLCFGLDDPAEAGRPAAAAREQAKASEPARVRREPGPSRPADDTVQADPVGAEPEAATRSRVASEAEAPQLQAEGLMDLGEPVRPEAPADGVAEAVGPELPEGWAELTQTDRRRAGSGAARRKGDWVGERLSRPGGRGGANRGRSR